MAIVAFDLGLVSETFFVALVLVAIVTSLSAGYWLRYVKGKGWELLQNQAAGMASKEECQLLANRAALSVSATIAQ